MPDSTYNGVIVRRSVVKHITQIIDNNPPTGRFREIFPTDTDGGFGTIAFETQSINYVGEARVIAGGYVDDLPTADFEKDSAITPLRILGASYEISQLEIEQSKTAGFPLKETRLRAALRAHEIAHNRIAFLGATNWGLAGLINNPNIPLVNVPPGASALTEWESKTADEIVHDVVNVAITAIENATDMDLRPNKILMAKDKYDYIKVLPYSQFESKPVLDVIIDSLVKQGVLNGGADIIPMKELNDAGPGETPIAVAMLKDPSYIAYRLPEEAQAWQSEWKSTYWRTPIVSATGGLDVKQPLAHAVLTGI